MRMCFQCRAPLEEMAVRYAFHFMVQPDPPMPPYVRCPTCGETHGLEEKVLRCKICRYGRMPAALSICAGSTQIQHVYV